MHVVTNTPAGSMKLFAHTHSSTAAFPTKSIGRHLHHVFRGLLGVYSHYNLHAHGAAKTALCIEGSDDFVTSAAASIVTGWNEPVPGRDYTPLKSTAFHGARSSSRWRRVGDQPLGAARPVQTGTGKVTGAAGIPTFHFGQNSFRTCIWNWQHFAYCLRPTRSATNTNSP